MQYDTDAADRALGRVAHDIRTTTDLRDELTLEVGERSLGFSAHRGDRVVGGRAEPVATEHARAVAGYSVHLAGLVQRHYVMEALFRGWPRCPEHEHVLEPQLRTSRALWACPQGGPTFEIGRLERG